MNAITAIAISLPFLIYTIFTQKRNYRWFEFLAKPPTYPRGPALGALSLAYWACQITALFLTADNTNPSAYIFIALNVLCAVITYFGFARRQLIISTAITGVYYFAQVYMIITTARISVLAAILTLLTSWWTLYAIYAGVYMHVNNPPRTKKAE